MVLKKYQPTEKPIFYSIYTIDGRIVTQGLLESSHIAIPMVKGVYVVKIGERFVKIS